MKDGESILQKSRLHSDGWWGVRISCMAPLPPPLTQQCLTSFSSLFLINHTKRFFFNIFGFETKIHISHVCKNQKRDSPSIFCLLSVNYRPTDECQYFCKNLSSSFTNDLTRRVERFSPGRAGHILGIFL